MPLLSRNAHAGIHPNKEIMKFNFTLFKRIIVFFRGKQIIKMIVVVFLCVLIPLLLCLLPSQRPGTGLIATYYNNPNWEGSPVLVQREEEINLLTYEQANVQGKLPDENFSIAWNGWIRIDQTGDYDVTTISDDGSSVVIDDQLVVNNGGFHGAREVEAEVSLKKGMHKIQVNYFNGPESYTFSFSFAKDAKHGASQPLPPTVFFPHQLSRLMEIYTREPGILYIWGTLSFCLGVLIWKYDTKLLAVFTLPPLVWILIGFTISYFLFFIEPVFFNMSHEMQFFRSVPAWSPIGIDLKQMIEPSELWLSQGHFVVIGLPIYILLFPYALVNFFTAFKIHTIITVGCYLLITLLLPLLISKERQFSPLLTLFCLSGLFSYGFLFGLERGQLYVIVSAWYLFAVWLHHAYPRYRYVAYILFSLAVQFKYCPAIFIVMFVRNWADWKNSLRYMIEIAVCNVALCLILGPQVFIESFNLLRSYASVHVFHKMYNHSIQAFSALFFSEDSHYRINDWSWLWKYKDLLQMGFFAGTALCILLLLLQAYRQKQRGLNPYILLACTLGALLLPASSIDYKLPMLVGPISTIFFTNQFPGTVHTAGRRLVFNLLICTFFFAYSSTLFSYTNKPLLLQNNAPALLVMLLATTCLSLIFQPTLYTFNNSSRT